MTSDHVRCAIAQAAGLAAGDRHPVREVLETLTLLGGDAPCEPSEPDTTPMQEMAMKIRPLLDHVVVKRMREDEQIKPDTPVAMHHQGQRLQRVVFSAVLAVAASGCFWREGGEPRHEERYETRRPEHHEERGNKSRPERRDESRPEHRD